ncbi:Receptor-interacting serine/threonine-protein kinase 1 [Marasmius sp. AFHP31]|nr:Receptor-interacting serine/threonine-protein kinase 1 [Marasmius sp. AFHP31]
MDSSTTQGPLWSRIPEGLDDLRHVVQAVISDREQYKKVLEARGHEAQQCLNALHTLLGLPDVENRPSILQLMLRLSKRSNLYPECLSISNVDRISERPIDGGGFGDVWKGKIDGQFVCLKVVKVYLVSDVQKLLREYMREAIVWEQLRHPNLLPFMGMYYLDEAREQLCLVSPWMDRGNLVKYLKNTLSELVDHQALAYDVASGLAHLHSMNIIHGDMKGVRYTLSASRVETNGTCQIFDGGNAPFHGLNEAAVMMASVAFKREQPARPTGELTDEMWEIMVACWNQEAQDRPAANDVRTRVGAPYSRKTGSQVQSYPAPEWGPRPLQVRNHVNHPTNIGCTSDFTTKQSLKSEVMINNDQVTFTSESDCETTTSNHWETQGVGHDQFASFALDPGLALGIGDHSQFLDSTNQSPANTIMNGMATSNMDFFILPFPPHLSIRTLPSPLSADVFDQRVHCDTLTIPASPYSSISRTPPLSPGYTFNGESIPIDGPSRRQRSSSIVSTSSSFSGDVSDSQGYDASQEQSEGCSDFSRDSSPDPIDRAMSNDDLLAGFDSYMSNIRSAAIVRACIDRRKKNA